MSFANNDETALAVLVKEVAAIVADIRAGVHRTPQFAGVDSFRRQLINASFTDKTQIDMFGFQLAAQEVQARVDELDNLVANPTKVGAKKLTRSVVAMFEPARFVFAHPALDQLRLINAAF